MTGEPPGTLPGNTKAAHKISTMANEILLAVDQALTKTPFRGSERGTLLHAAIRPDQAH